MTIFTRAYDGTQLVRVEQMHGNTFNGEDGAHQFVITGVPTGTVTAYMMRADGTTCTVDGTNTDGSATVTLNQDCYNVPGRFTLSIFVGDTGARVCVYACIGTVYRTRTETIIDSGDVVPSLDDVIAKQAELAQDVSDASSAIASAQNAVSYLAPGFLTSKTYKVGEYVTQDGALYICTTPVETAGAWDASKWQIVTFGEEVTDLKSAINNAFIESANLFDKNAVVPNKALDIGSGKTIESMIDSQVLCVSPIIQIEAGQYVCNSLFYNSSIRLNAYNADGEYLGGFYGTQQADGSYIFNVTGGTVRQGRFSYRPTTLNVDTFMFVNGSTLPQEYESYGTKLNPAYVSEQIQTAIDAYEIPDGSVTPTKTTFTEHDPDTNLIDIAKCTLGYIDGGTDGSVHSSTTFYCTDFIPLKANTDYYYNSYYLYSGYCAFYDENKTYISGYSASSATDRLAIPFRVPDGAVYGRFTIISEARLANVWLCETNQMPTKPKAYTEEIQTKFIIERPTDYKGDEISVFTKILCIGDSLTDGCFNESGGSRLIMRNRSFPAKLQALTGIQTTNMGYAGYTSVQWYDAYQNEDLSGHDACIIQLGVNDGLNSVSVADMTTAFQNIITKVKNENAGIKIFVATIIPANGYMTSTMRTYAEFIRTIVSDLNDRNVYLVDLWNYGHTDDYLAYDAGHLSALGYLRLAEDYKAYISYIIRNDPNNFRYVQFIGTDYTFAGDSTTRQIYY